MITCWTSAEFKAWNDVYKKLRKDVRKGTTQDFIQGEDGQPISPIQTEQIREWIDCYKVRQKELLQLSNQMILNTLNLIHKNSLFAIEKGIVPHIQRVARGDSIKVFWTLPPPVKVTYTKPTKKGNLGAEKTCGQCKKQKDGYGEKNTNNHKRNICDNNFLYWSKVLYPLPKTNLYNVLLRKNMLGK
ncbi:hypothetical protein BT69DRAFT_1304215 [Atractiella rhizophila]|nr:hypothetical protein BT69DRAFT_1304215 [Atractiella rhizophila]